MTAVTSYYYWLVYSLGKRLSRAVFEFLMLNIDFVKENGGVVWTITTLSHLHNSLIVSKLRV